MDGAALGRLRRAMGTAERLPKPGQHFNKHREEFADLGVTTQAEYEQMFLAHLARSDTRVFTYISTTQPTAYRHWAIVGMDNGAVALYNESKGEHWSFRRERKIEEYLQRHSAWWVETNWDGTLKARRR
jgi:phage pi2 protein 07